MKENQFTNTDEIEDEVEMYLRELSNFYMSDDELIEVLKKINLLISNNYPNIDMKKDVLRVVQILNEIKDRLNIFKNNGRSAYIIQYTEDIVANIESVIAQLGVQKATYDELDEDETTTKAKIFIEGAPKESPPNVFERNRYLLYLMPTFMWPYLSDRFNKQWEDAPRFMKWMMTYRKIQFTFIVFLFICVILMALTG